VIVVVLVVGLGVLVTLKSCTFAVVLMCGGVSGGGVRWGVGCYCC